MSERLKELAALPDDWDGYGAKKLSETAVETAESLTMLLTHIGAPAPFIAPTTTGGVQLEWHRAELEIGPDGTIACFTEEG